MYRFTKVMKATIFSAVHLVHFLSHVQFSIEKAVLTTAKKLVINISKMKRPHWLQQNADNWSFFKVIETAAFLVFPI